PLRDLLSFPTRRSSDLVNVIDNAIDALAGVPEGRRIDLFLDNGAGAATVRVRDNGSGIPADKLDRIFNPFFTSKEKGTGLGMARSEEHTSELQSRSDLV